MSPELAALWTLLDALPDTAVLPSTVKLLREAKTASECLAPAGAGMLTTETAATHFDVSLSTARVGLAKCPSAVKLGKHGWRLPAAAIQELETVLRGAEAETADLSGWRSAYPETSRQAK